MTNSSERFVCRRPTCSDFDLTFGNPKSFVNSQIPIRRSYLLIIVWNIVWFIYFFTSVFLDVFYFVDEDRNVWILSFSNWSFILAIITIFGDTSARIAFLVCDKDLESVTDSQESRDILWYQKIQWTLINVNNVVCIITSALYFSFYTIEMTYSSVSKHVMTSVYVILTTACVTSVPIKLFHFYHSAIFISVYAAFISIYQSQKSSPNIYLVLNWTDAQYAAILFVCLIFIGCPVIHILMYLIYKLRTLLYTKCSEHAHKTHHGSMQRDATTTEVVLEDNSQFVDITPDVKDDIGIKTISTISNGDVFKRYNARIFKSETDLRDYRTKNGLYCDFARNSLILHPRSNSLHTAHTAHVAFEEVTNNNTLEEVKRDTENGPGLSSKFRRSQIIVVKKCQTCLNEPEADGESDDAKSCDSNASSDFLSQYITEDILSYL